MAHRARFPLLFALVVSSSSTAGAAECQEDAAACGRKAFEAGIEAFRKGDFVAAAKSFEEAQGFRPHPVVLFNLALAESKLERHVEALAHFDQVLADPQLSKDLRPKVEDERAKTERNVAVIELEVGEGAETLVDGERIDGTSARVNPGTHSVRVTDKGRTVLDRSVRLRPGERLRLSVDRTTEVVVAPPKGGGQAGADPGASSHAGPSPVWFYAGLGLTAVLGGVTIWSGLDTQKAFDDYEKDLPTLTQSEVNQRVDEGHSKETRTNVLIAATAVAAVGTAALGLFVVDFGGKQQPSAGLVIGPGTLSAVGRF